MAITSLRHPAGRAAAVAVPVAVALAALGIYWRTAARTITWAHGGADGAELSAAAAVLGVAHPPGYPLYVLLGHLFAQIPVGEVAFRVGLLSVVSAALGAGLAAHLAATLTREQESGAGGRRSGARGQHPAPSTQHSALSTRVVAAAAAGVGLATSPMYWSQATITEVYALHAALVLAALCLLIAWRPGRDRLAAVMALLFGIGLGNHATLAFLAALAGMFVLLQDRGLLLRRSLLLVGGAFAVGLLVYLYLPVRAAADPPINWGEPADWPRFIYHVTAQAYRGYLGGRPAGDVLARVPVMARMLGEQFTWPGLVLALVGLGELMRLRPALGRLLLAYLIVTAGFTLIYNAKDGEIYLLPAALVLAPALGVGVARLAAVRGGTAIALALVALMATWQIWTHGPTMDLSDDRVAVEWARSTLSAQPPGLALPTNSDEHTFALWYVQIVEGLRQDVVVVDQRGLGLPWYRAQLERRHPGVLDSLPGG